MLEEGIIRNDHPLSHLIQLGDKPVLFFGYLASGDKKISLVSSTSKSVINSFVVCISYQGYVNVVDE